MAFWWFISGMALAIGYTVLVYRRFGGSVVVKSHSDKRKLLDVFDCFRVSALRLCLPQVSNGIAGTHKLTTKRRYST